MVVQSARLCVAGMVTLYNSEPDILQRMGTYVGQVGKLYVVDNSEQSNNELINAITAKYPTVEYITNSGNKGIAYALNTAAKAAILDEFQYLLMMDDDSETPADLVNALYSIISKSVPDGDIGIVSAQSDPSVQRDDEQEVVTTITSGSLLNLKAYQSGGPFLDDLFIDWVDHEYCFRLSMNGYRVVIANHVRLTHRLGVFKKKRLFGFLPVRWRSHNPTRLYYKFRNSLYVMNKYRNRLRLSFILSVYYELLRDIVKVTFMEEHKEVYLTSVRRGLMDAYRKRLGKLSDQ